MQLLGCIIHDPRREWGENRANRYTHPFDVFLAWESVPAEMGRPVSAGVPFLLMERLCK